MFSLVHSKIPVLPLELWLHIMTFSDYRTISMLRMCCRQFGTLSDSVALDANMFRSRQHMALEHDIDETKIELHPISQCIWWAGCGCKGHIVIRCANKLRRGLLRDVSGYLCQPDPDERSIPDLEQEQLQEYFENYPAATLKTMALLHPAMRDYLTFPALKDVWIDDLDPRPLIHLHNDTGVTLGDMCRALLKQARTSLDFTDQILRDYSVEFKHEGFRELFTADYMTIVFPKVKPDMSASWEEFGVALEASCTLYKRNPRIHAGNPLHGRIGTIYINSDDVIPPATELETAFYARLNNKCVSNWLDEIDEEFDIL